MPPSALPPDLAAGRRRSRVVYAVAIAVLLLAVGLTMGLVIGTGEAAHATLVTGTAAPAVPGGTVRPDPAPIWHTDDHAASGSPLWVGTVVTWSAHRLAGRDATTGALRWSYTRTDLSVCDAAQQNGRAYVLFGRDGDCDEISTFDAETGTRGWFRTLPDTGEGRLRFGATGLVIAYPGSFHAMDLARGIDRFPMVPTTGPGCRFTAVVPGQGGIVASERCGDGGHLALWSNNGQNSQAQRLWRVDVDSGVTAVAADDTFAFGWDPVAGALSRYAVKDGAGAPAVTLDPGTTGPAGPSQALGGDVLFDLGDRVYQLSEVGQVVWSVAATGPPSVADGTGTQVLVPTTAGAELVDAITGESRASYTLPAASGDERAQVFPAGSGLLVVGSGLTYLR